MSVPVIYYHSIADHEVNHPWAFLSCPIEIFRKQMEWLSKNNYYTCTWKELEDHISGMKILPSKSIHIHFDDGFLDNWSVVFPIMEKYNLKYTILITPEFVEDNDIIRPFVSETKENNKSNWWGYLSKGEISKMVEIGLVDFQAHGYTHTWYPVSSTVIDIIDNSSFYPHIYWNSDIKSKPHWLTKSDYNIEHFNEVVFEYGKSLEVDKVFIVDEEALSKVYGDLDNSLDKKLRIQKLNEAFRTEGRNIGRYETDKEKTERLTRELKSTKEEVFSLTERPCDYVVFPGGGNTKEVLGLCKKVGYKQVSKGEKLNSANSNIYQINRMTGYHDFGGRKKNLYGNLLLLRLQVKRGSGSSVVSYLISMVKRIKRLIK